MHQVFWARLPCHTAAPRDRGEPDYDPADLRSNILGQPRSSEKDILPRSMRRAILALPCLEDFRSVARSGWEPGCKEPRTSPMCYSTAPSREYAALAVLPCPSCE